MRNVKKILVATSIIIFCIEACVFAQEPLRSRGGRMHPVTSDWVSPRGKSSTSVPSGEFLELEIGDGVTHYLDPEVWAPTRQMAWQDGRTNEVWICDIDPASGRFLPADGRGVRCGVAAPVLPQSETELGTFNGPEWGLDADGLFVYLTILDNQIMQAARFGPVGKANPELTQLTFGGTINRGGAYPTQNRALSPGAAMTFMYPPGEPAPQFSAWRFHDEPSTDRPVPLGKIGAKGPRWIPGELAISTNAYDKLGRLQIARFDVETESLNLLTSGRDDKTDAIFFDAPEWNANSFVCCVGKRHLAFYSKSPTWKRIGQIKAPHFIPGGGPVSAVGAFEPFVFNGRTYVVFSVGIDLDLVLRYLLIQLPESVRQIAMQSIPAIAQITNGKPASLVFDGPLFKILLSSRVYVASLEDLTPIEVSDSTLAYRIDPEALVIDDRVFLYINSYRDNFENPTLHVIRISPEASDE